jgi:putative transposase
MPRRPGPAGGRRRAGVREVRRRHRIAEKTYYYRKQHYGRLQVAETERLKTLKDEHQRLAKLVADQALDLAMLRDVVGREWNASCPASRGDLPDDVEAAAGRHPPHGRLRVSERRACRVTGFARSSQRYWSRRPRRDKLARSQPAASLACATHGGLRAQCAASASDPLPRNRKTHVSFATLECG